MEEKDRWNLGKLKVLRTLRRSDSNAIRIAERTRKSVGSTDNILKRLLKNKQIKTVPCTKFNDGCCYRFAITPKGRNYLQALQTRFLASNDLNLKFDIPMHVNYKAIDKAFAMREYPPAYPEITGELRDFKLPLSIQDAIITRKLNDIRIITVDKKPCAKGDLFEVYGLKYVIYHIEVFTLEAYSSFFSQYHKPKDPEDYYKKLKDKHPGAVFVYLLYFKRFKEEI